MKSNDYKCNIYAPFQNLSQMISHTNLFTTQLSALPSPWPLCRRSASCSPGHSGTVKDRVYKGIRPKITWIPWLAFVAHDGIISIYTNDVSFKVFDSLCLFCDPSSTENIGFYKKKETTKPEHRKTKQKKTQTNTKKNPRKMQVLLLFCYYFSAFYGDSSCRVAFWWFCCCLCLFFWPKLIFSVLHGILSLLHLICIYNLYK